MFISTSVRYKIMLLGKATKMQPDHASVMEALNNPLSYTVPVISVTVFPGSDRSALIRFV
jgi:hypothetical protein